MSKMVDLTQLPKVILHSTNGNIKGLCQNSDATFLVAVYIG